MENQIAETEQWLLEGNCDKCRKDAYCDKECTAYKKAMRKAAKEAMDNALKKAQEKWNAEHPYIDKKGRRYKTQEEADEANKLIEEREKKNEQDSNISEGEQGTVESGSAGSDGV